VIVEDLKERVNEAVLALGKERREDYLRKVRKTKRP
jgi:hypothetical protein